MSKNLVSNLWDLTTTGGLGSYINIRNSNNNARHNRPDITAMPPMNNKKHITETHDIIFQTCEINRHANKCTRNNGTDINEISMKTYHT